MDKNTEIYIDVNKCRYKFIDLCTLGCCGFIDEQRLSSDSPIIHQRIDFFDVISICNNAFEYGNF